MLKLLALLVLITYTLSAPLLRAESPDAIKDHYLIVLRPDITMEKAKAHVANLTASFEMEDASDNKMGNSFHIGSLIGFSAKLSASMLNREKLSYDVDYIEQDQVMRSSQACYQQQTSEWGLDRIAERALNLDGTYTYEYTGDGVDAYVVDTGVLTTHVDFEGRAIWGANFVNDGINADCNGHGTHVAGTIGGRAYGVAKKVTLIAVKVLGCTGSGSTAGVVDGVNYVVSQYNSRKNPSVANMSLGGGVSPTMDSAVSNAVAAGVSFALAAGNSNTDACNSSPARVGGAGPAVTAGATTVENIVQELDVRASFSNYGVCTDIFAPGQLITSDWYTSNTAIMTLSGTSMASPHVAGAISLYLGANPSATPAQAKAFVTGDATVNLIDLDCSTTSCSNSPNRLLYSSCS